MHGDMNDLLKSEAVEAIDEDNRGPGAEVPGSYIFKVLDLIDPANKLSTETLYRSLLGVFLRQLGDGQKLAPSHADLILLHALTLLHPELPFFIRERYCPQLGQEQRILDYEMEILKDADDFLATKEDAKAAAKKEYKVELEDFDDDDFDMEIAGSFLGNEDLTAENGEVEEEEAGEGDDQASKLLEQVKMLAKEGAFKFGSVQAEFKTEFDADHDDHMDEDEEEEEDEDEEAEDDDDYKEEKKTIKLKKKVKVRRKKDFGEYTCDLCDYAGTKNGLRKHKQRKHEENRPPSPRDMTKYPCEFCDYIGTKTCLKNHQTAKHGIGKKKPRVQCDYCPRTFENNYKLRLHRMVDHEGHRFMCDQCDFGGSKAQLKHHVDSVHLQRFKCQLCDFNGTRQYYLKEHMETKHMGIRYKCDQCTASFGTERNLKTHVKDVHEEKPEQEPKSFICDQCDFITDKNIKLKIHIDSVHLQRYYCVECSLNFSSKNALNNHTQRKHTGQPKQEYQLYMCDECPFKTGRKGHLKMHQSKMHGKITETKAKAYYCDKCTYRTNWQKALAEHNENKHGTKVFSCDLCDYTTTLPKEYEKHWGYRHDPSTKRYPCDQCHYSATYIQSLKTHIQIVHEKVRYPCDLCDYKATIKADIAKHKRAVHDMIRVNCDYCELSYSENSSLRYHIQAKHPEKYVKYSTRKKELTM